MPELCGKVITAIIFDLDNTLIPTRNGDLEACNKTAEYLHASYKIEMVRAKNMVLSFLNKFRFEPRIYEYEDENGEIVALDISQWRIRVWRSVLKEYADYAEDVYSKWLKVRYCFLICTPEIKSMLLQLRKIYKLGLLTNGDSDAQWEKINQIGLEEYFDAVLVSGDVCLEKPNPKIFFKMCYNLAVEPANCLMIGDTIETDINGAIAAKCALTALVITNRYTKEEMEKYKRIPDIVLDRVTKLIDVIKVL